MIRRAIPNRFDRTTETGRNRPLIISVETADGVEHEAYLKISGRPEMGVEGLANEALAACLAADLGIPITEPFLIDLDPDWIAAIPDLATRAVLLQSATVGFASTAAGAGWKTWSFSEVLSRGRIDAALAIFVFDALIENEDRRPSNPNCLVKGNDLRVIDHELSFRIRMKFAPRPEPWRLGYFTRLVARDGHLFGAALKARGLDLTGIRNRWSDLNLARLRGYGSSLPDEWAGASTAVKDAIDHLCRVRERLDQCFEELERALT